MGEGVQDQDQVFAVSSPAEDWVDPVVGFNFDGDWLS